MKLSIITINYNNLEGLKKTYDSVVCQTWTDYEWIVIDGGSTDGSREFIEEHQDKFAYWCSEPDKGVYNAMNKGIAKAQGEYLNFMNSGDRYHSRSVLAEVFSSNHMEDILYGDCNFISSNGSRVFHYPKDLTLHYFLYRSLGHPASFIKTTLLKGCGYRENFKIVSDWYQFVQWFREGKTFSHIDITLADFDTTGISSANKELLRKEREDLYEELFGPENRDWVEESVEMQKMHEKCSNGDVTSVLRICERGGKRLSVLHYIIRLLNVT